MDVAYAQYIRNLANDNSRRFLPKNETMCKSAQVNDDKLAIIPTLYSADCADWTILPPDVVLRTKKIRDKK